MKLKAVCYDVVSVIGGNWRPDYESLVKYYGKRRHGTTYPDMMWEPKGAFKAVAEYYAKNTRPTGAGHDASE